MSIQKSLDSAFPPQTFSDSTANKALMRGEKDIIVRVRDDLSFSAYDNLDSNMSLFLSKLPSGNVRKYVTNLLNKKLIFYGISATKDDGVFARLFLNPSGKISGIAFDATDINFDIRTGSTDSIDDIIYAVYFGIIRAAVLANKIKIKQDTELHKVLSTYLFLLYIKINRTGLALHKKLWPQ